MATMYFAKININEEIYEVYKHSEKAEEIFCKLLSKKWQEETIVHTQGNKLNQDSDKEEVYKFINIDMVYDKGYLVGRLIEIFRDDLSLYDRNKDDINSISQSELSREIPFYFDWKNEIVAFIPSKKFSRKKFLVCFEELLNKIYGEQMFSVYLKNNIGDLKRAVNSFSKVSEIEITLVPPNSNKEEFDDLFPKSGDELEETQGTKFYQKISAPHSKTGLNIQASLFQRMITGVAKGFGQFTALGKDSSGNTKRFSSDKSAPQRKYIKESSRNSFNEVIEYGRAGIIEILEEEIRRKLDE